MIKLLSINIINQKDKQYPIILNPTSHPIIFYWNDLNENNIIDEIFQNEQFLEYMNSNILNINNYSFSHIYYNEYAINEDKIQQKSMSIQDIYELEKNHLYNLVLEYIYDIMVKLYQIVYKKNYENDDKSEIDNIINIYTILKEKYKERVSSTTLEQYIRSQLQQNYLLNNANIEYVINIYKDLIN